MESGGGGAQQEDAGGKSCGGGECRAGHGGHEDDGPDGQRPADRTVAGDVHEMVEPEQQRSDRDGDGGQDPVAVACCDDDDGKDEGGDQLDDGGNRHRSLDGLSFGAGGPAPDPGGDPDGVDQDNDDQNEGDARQGGPHCPADVKGAADQPEGRESQLDVASDLAYAL